MQSWNNHPISGERNFSPNQLFIHGALQQDNVNSLFDSHTTVMNIPDPNDAVSIPNMPFQPCSQQLKLIDPLALSNSCGSDIYLLVINTVIIYHVVVQIVIHSIHVAEMFLCSLYNNIVLNT